MVGGRIRRLREQAAFTQDELARSAGISTSALVRIEGGQALPRLSTLRKLAEALAVDVKELTAELRGLRPSESEEDIAPIDELRQIGSVPPPLAVIRARGALQRVAEDVITGIAIDDARLAVHLESLESLSRQLSGPLAAHGFALAEFLRALREETAARRQRPDLETAREAARNLKAVMTRSPGELAVCWEPVYQEVCRDYASLLAHGEPGLFHKAVASLLLLRAELAMEELAGADHATGEDDEDEPFNRRAFTALATVLSLFDLANGASQPRMSAAEVLTPSSAAS